jgi:DNA topoisomerase-3
MCTAADSNSYGPCPKCKVGIVRKTKMGAGCSRFKEGCGFLMWDEVNGKKLTEAHIRQLAIKG